MFAQKSAPMRAGSLAAFVFLFLLPLPIWTRLLFDYLNQGDGWRQGDWLINFGAGIVRRGVIGEGLILLSDLSGVALLVVTLLAQGALLGLLLLVFWLIWRAHNTRIMLVLLAASPMFCLMLWAGDVQGILRKELLGYLALGFLVLCSAMPRLLPLFATLFLLFFTLGNAGNLLHLFLTPVALIGVYLLCWEGLLSRRGSYLLGGTVIGIALFCFGFALLFKTVPEYLGMCQPLMERGFDAGFCEHAIRWLVPEEVDHSAEVHVRMTPEGMQHFAAISLIAVIPLLLACRAFGEWRFPLLIILAAFLPMLPLYVIATDWGRWFSISYMSAAFLLVMAHFAGRLSVKKAPAWPIVAALLLLTFVLTPDHGIGWKPGGVIDAFIAMIRDLT
jgi:hypothetical protein